MTRAPIKSKDNMNSFKNTNESLIIWHFSQWPLCFGVIKRRKPDTWASTAISFCKGLMQLFFLENYLVWMSQVYFSLSFQFLLYNASFFSNIRNHDFLNLYLLKCFEFPVLPFLTWSLRLLPFDESNCISKALSLLTKTLKHGPTSQHFPQWGTQNTCNRP